MVEVLDFMSFFQLIYIFKNVYIGLFSYISFKIDSVILFIVFTLLLCKNGSTVELTFG